MIRLYIKWAELDPVQIEIYETLEQAHARTQQLREMGTKGPVAFSLSNQG